MFVFDMSLQSKLKLIVFAGAFFIFVEYLDIMIYNFGQKSAHAKYFQRETDMVRDSKDDFQLVADDNSILVYSAYVEERADRLRVIGITSKRNNTLIYCILRYKQPERARVLKGYIHHIPESHGFRYTAAFFLCDLKDASVPDEVSVADTPTTQSTHNVLPVRRIPRHHSKHMFNACVSPLHSKYNDTAQITEWIELNRLLGVERFTFYLNSVSKNVRSVLKYYETKGIASLMPWTLPRKLSDSTYKMLHYCGQLAALNDCLYRTKGKSLYISSTDLDEFIIPQKPDDVTWSGMLSRLPSQSVYIIRSSFFSQKKSCSRKKKCSERLTIDSYKMRDDLILPSHKRSKYIAKTDELITMGIHFTWDLSTGNEYTVNPEVALLHHYRRDSKLYTQAAFTQITHRAAAKYTRPLHRNLQKMQNDFLTFSNKTAI